MAKKIQNVSELKGKIAKIRPVTPWEDVKENTIYHIPPLITLERREIFITKKDNNSANYYRIGDKEKKERTLANSSVYAKFLVKRKKY